MNIMVVGCGKVGSQLAGILSRLGHDVSVIEKNEENLTLLPDDFEGFKTSGIPIDQDVLREAGIESCDALAAVSASDAVNIMAGELAKEVFHVPTVIVRVNDPALERVFTKLGMHIVCPTNLTAAEIQSAILEDEKPQTVNFGAHTLSFIGKTVPSELVGKSVSSYPLLENQSAYALLHEDLSLTICQGQTLKFASGDRVIVSTIVD